MCSATAPCCKTKSGYGQSRSRDATLDGEPGEINATFLEMSVKLAIMLTALSH